MVTRIYVTHCSKRKDEKYRRTRKAVRLERLYTSTKIRQFIKVCKRAGVSWAILSDKYGVVFGECHAPYWTEPRNPTIQWREVTTELGYTYIYEMIPWYEKGPDTIRRPYRRSQEFHDLLRNLLSRLYAFPEIWFYYNPQRFHQLYRTLLEKVQEQQREVHLFSHIAEIK